MGIVVIISLQPSEMALLSFSLVFYSLFVYTLGDQSFYVLHAPGCVHFTATESKLPVSEISDLISVTYGLPLYQELTFKGLANGDLFKKPKAVFLITLNGIGDKAEHFNLNSQFEYPLYNDQVFPETASVISHLRRYMLNPLIVDFAEENTVFDMRSHHSKLFGSITSSIDKVRELIQSGNTFLNDFDIKGFNTSQYADILFLSEIQLVGELLAALKVKNEQVLDNVPDFYHFKLDGLKVLVEEYGNDHKKIHDAYGILQNFLKQITETINEIYDKNAVVQVVTISGENHDQSGGIRRSLLQSMDGEAVKIDNIAEPVDPDFSGNFNIVLWTSVVIGTVVIILAYAMWNIDPGRNSILYRMTSQRIKID